MALTKPKKVVQTNWHPDFRNVDALPDINVVRTEFFVKILTVTIAFVLLFYLGFHEYSGISLGSQIYELDSKISSKKNGNSKNLGSSSKFNKVAKKIFEVKEFMDSPIDTTEFLTFLGEAYPMKCSLHRYLIMTGNLRRVKKYLPFPLLILGVQPMGVLRQLRKRYMTLLIN